MAFSNPKCNTVFNEGWLSVGALVVNLAVVAMMVVALLQRRKARAELVQATALSGRA